MAMTKDEFARFQRREAALREISDAFHGRGVANWKHIASLVFEEMKHHLGTEFVVHHWHELDKHYGKSRLPEHKGKSVASRMIPEITEIVGDDEARHIFGSFGPLKVRDRQRMIDRALVNRYLNLPEPRNKALLIRERLEENERRPPEMQNALGGTSRDRLDDHIRKILKDFPGEAPHLKVVK